MLHNDVEEVINNLFKYLVGKENCARGHLVKIHDSNIHTHGEFSFPNNVRSWQEFFNHDSLQNLDGTLLQYINKDVTNLIETSKNWDIPIANAVEQKGRISLYIDRLKSIQVCFPTAVYNNNYILDRLNIDITEINFEGGYKNINCLTYLRLKLITNVLKNIYLISLYPKKAKIVVSWNNMKKTKDSRVVYCGPVLDGTSGAKVTKTSEEYIRKRQDEIMLIAQHKYGYRVSSDSKWKEFISHLGESAIAFELLQARCSSPVKMYFVSNGGTSKGAAFVLYNCARLETIIKTFNEKVADGTYPALPPMENIDFSLLNDKDEWNLIYCFIMTLPNLLQNCVEFSETKCEFKPHLICGFLCSMVKTISQYYRRVRILTEPRQHLLPTLFARIHFIMILNNTLKVCLKILNIKSVSQMYIIFFLFPILFFFLSFVLYPDFFILLVVKSF